MRRLKKVLIIFIFLLSTIFTTGCIFETKTLSDKIDFEGFWKCEEYNFTIELGTGYAYMDYEEKQYEFIVNFGRRKKSIILYDLMGINGELFECWPKISKDKDSFTIDIGDCYIPEISNKTLKFVHITRDELLKDNTVYEKLNNNSKWINQEENIELKIINEIGQYDKLIINDLEYCVRFNQDWKRIYVEGRNVDGKIEYETFGIFEVEDCGEGIKLKVLNFCDESILEVGVEIVLLLNNKE